MNSVVIKPELEQEFKKAMKNGRIVFFSAPCGFGKTTVSKALLKGMKVYTILAGEENFVLPSEKDENWDVLLVDNFQLIEDADEQQELLTLIRNCKNKRFVILSRGVPSGWLAPFQFSGLMQIFNSRDLLFDRTATGKYFEMLKMELTAVELTAVHKECWGYPPAISFYAQRFKKGEPYNAATSDYVRRDLYMFFEESVYNRFDLPLRRFLLELAPFDYIEPDLARMVSGDSKAGELLGYLQKNTTMFISGGVEKFKFWFIFKDFLMWEINKSYTAEQIQNLYNRGGLYYELKEEYPMALECYLKSGDHRKISEILVKHSRLHPGTGHYMEMEKYYRKLPESEILESPSLMQAMSILCALCNDYSGSEKWYMALQNFAMGKKRTDALAKEAASRLAWLDISLPQRSVMDIKNNIVNIYKMIKNKEISLLPFSVTSMLPSILNGGKDFSPWTKIDDLLYATIRIPLETVLGKDGVGIADCAIAESKFEKGEDVSARMLNLVSHLSEIQQKGTPDMEFAVVGLLARNQVDMGRAEDAKRSIESIKKRFSENGNERFLPNIDAMLCRIELKMGNLDSAEAWYRDKAPKDVLRLNVLKRYQYFTQAMTEIAKGDYEAVLLTLAPLEPYCKTCQRNSDMLHLNVLKAAAKFKMNNEEWKTDFSVALDIAYEFKYIRPISNYGAVGLVLLDGCGWNKDEKYKEKLLLAARKQAVYYPDFLKFKNNDIVEPLTSAEMQVLRLLCADKTNAEIGEILDIKLTTVKSHVSHVLQKLGVKRRNAVKKAAEDFHLL